MPAKRLDAAVVRITKFDVTGQDCESVSEFVRHVALSAADVADVCVSDRVLRLTHMEPPLVRDGDEREVSVIAWAELSAEELLQIQVFIEELDAEYAAQRARGILQYTIRPHEVAPDSQFPFRRFSCAGLVLGAYSYAGIDLLTTDDSSLPEVSLESLKRAYRDQASRLDSSIVRERYGLADAEFDRWKVVLAGYVIHALNRTSQEIRRSPYTAVPGDEFFPRRAV